MRRFEAFVGQSPELSIPTHLMEVGDTAYIRPVEGASMHGVREHLFASAVRQNKAFWLSEITGGALLLLCLRSAKAVWVGPLREAKAAQILNYRFGSYGLEDMQPGAKLEVVSLPYHLYFIGDKKLHYPSIRVYVAKYMKKTAKRFKIHRVEPTRFVIERVS